MNVDIKQLFIDVAKEHYKSIKNKYDHTPATKRKKYTKNNKGGLKDV